MVAADTRCLYMCEFESTGYSICLGVVCGNECFTTVHVHCQFGCACVVFFVCFFASVFLLFKLL